MRPSSRGINPLTKFERIGSVGDIAFDQNYGGTTTTYATSSILGNSNGMAIPSLQRPQTVSTGMSRKDAAQSKEEVMRQFLESSASQRMVTRQQQQTNNNNISSSSNNSSNYNMNNNGNNNNSNNNGNQRMNVQTQPQVQQGGRNGGFSVLNEVRGAQFRVLSSKQDDHICEKCMELRRTLKLMKLRNDELKRSNIEVQEIGYRKNLELENQLAALREEQERLLGMLGRDPRAVVSHELEHLKSHIANLEAEVSASNSNSAKLVEDLDLYRGEMGKLEERLLTEQKERNEEKMLLEETIRMLHEQRSNSDVDKGRDEALYSRIKELEGMVEANVKDIGKLKEDLDVERQKVGEMEQMAMGFKGQVAEKNKEIDSLLQQISEIKCELEKHKDLLEKAVKEKKFAETQATAAQLEKTAIQKELSSVTDALSRESKLLQESQEKLKTLARENAQEVMILEGKLKHETQAKDVAVRDKTNAMTALTEAEKRFQEEVERLQSALEEAMRRAETSKVVVVTPRIFITIPSGQAKEWGQMELPADVIRKLVVQQLGYEPGEIRSVNDISEIAELKKRRGSGSN